MYFANEMGENKKLSNLGDWYIDTDSITPKSVPLCGVASNFTGIFDKHSFSFSLFDKSQ